MTVFSGGGGPLVLDRKWCYNLLNALPVDNYKL